MGIGQGILGLLSRIGMGKFLDLLDRLCNHLCQLLVDLLEMPLVAGVGGAVRTAWLGAGAVTSYNLAFVTAHGGTTASAAAALLAGLEAGQAYLNIHTTMFPGGEIRGFLQEP